MATLTVPSRFNGPPASGQGGYSAAKLAAHLDGPVAVSLRQPVPLDKELSVRVARDGAGPGGDGAAPLAARAFDAGEDLVAEAVAAAPLSPWDGPRVDPDAAGAAAARFVATDDGTFDRCFVCGRARHEDGFHVFPGPVAGTDLVAAPWTPPAWAADADGAVLPEFVWAALDCPGYFAAYGGDLTLAFLARYQAAISTAPRAGVEYVVVGRPLGRDGRKGFAATAILDHEGTVLAHSEQLLVVLRAA